MSQVTQKLEIPGAVCGFSGIVAVAAAWYTGNALAFIVGCALLAGLAFHWVVARCSIRSLEIEVHPLAQRARAFAPFPFKVRLRNSSFWLPARFLKIKLVESGKNREQTLVFPHTLSPGQSASLVFYQRFGRRGRQRLNLVDARSPFPFGFTSSIKTYSLATTPVRIWPESISFNTDLFRNLEHLRLKRQAWTRPNRRDTADPNRFREYLPGDSKRRINWKLSAKSGKLIVIEDPNGTQASIWFFINTYPSHWRRPVDFENGLRLIASALEESFGRRILAGAVINNQRIPIRSQADLENALDQLSDLSMDLSADSRIPNLKIGEYLVCCDRKGVALKDWKKGHRFV